MTTLEQRRAQDTWKRCERYTQEQVNLVKRLPALIMNSGLMQVIAFLEQKNSDHRKVSKDLRRWLSTRFQNLPVEFSEFMDWILQVDSQTYQAITTESMAWLRWMRQMATARTNQN